MNVRERTNKIEVKINKWKYKISRPELYKPYVFHVLPDEMKMELVCGFDRESANYIG